jgi:hypothetical protein
MIVELKITNPSDWAIIQPLLKRLKIAFVEKEESLNNMAQKPDAVYYTKEQKLETLIQSEETAYVWSPYDSFGAAEILLDALKKNK